MPSFLYLILLQEIKILEYSHIDMLELPIYTLLSLHLTEEAGINILCLADREAHIINLLVLSLP